MGTMKIKVVAPPELQVQRVDRWVYPLLAEHLPADVDLEGGVRRVGPDDRAPQVLLRGEKGARTLSVDQRARPRCQLAPVVPRRRAPAHPMQSAGERELSAQ